MRLLSAFLFFLAGFQCVLAIPYCVIIPGKNGGPKGTYGDRSIAASQGHARRPSARTLVDATIVLRPSECILGAIRHRSINSANAPSYHNPTNNSEGIIDGKPLQDDAFDSNINQRNNDLNGEVRIVQLFQKL